MSLKSSDILTKLFQNMIGLLKKTDKKNIEEKNVDT